MIYIVYDNSNSYQVFDCLADLRAADDRGKLQLGAIIFKPCGKVIKCPHHGVIAAHQGYCPECGEDGFEDPRV